MTKFYELSTEQRLQQLQEHGILTASEKALFRENIALPTTIANRLVENQIGTFSLPLGLANHFLIDGHQYLVPMAVEEPSVIAAASNAAQRVARSGGFTTQVQRQGIRAQIVFVGQLGQPGQFLRAQQKTIKQFALQAHPSLIEHGGGLRQIMVQQQEEFVEFQLLIDPGEAMGANVVNTIAEAVGHYLQTQLPQLEYLMAILSNHAPEQRVQAVAEVQFAQLQTSNLSGEVIARKIVQASKLAQISLARAATHNKGIMNGVQAVVLATGNDTRNVAASVYAGLNDQHRSLSSWHLTPKGLRGVLNLNLPLGSVGGAISTLPLAQINLKILQHPSAAQLMRIIASVGLASNLAALRALVTQGIQAGHMNLQLQSLALMAGARNAEIDLIVKQLRQQPQQANLAQAKALITKLRQQSQGGIE